MSLRIFFKYQNQNEPKERSENIDINVPGTKVTSKMAVYVAQQFLTLLEERPLSKLISASCKVASTGQPVFDLGPVKQHSDPDCRFCRILMSKVRAITARYPHRDVIMWRLELYHGDWIRGHGPKKHSSTTGELED